MCDNLGISQNIFHRLDRVSASDLYKPDMLHIIYLGLFKHMMDWIEGFLKKHGRRQAFDNLWKALPPYISKKKILHPDTPCTPYASGSLGA